MDSYARDRAYSEHVDGRNDYYYHEVVQQGELQPPKSVEESALLSVNLPGNFAAMNPKNPKNASAASIQRVEKTKFIPAVVLVMNAIMGSGILGLPYAMRWTGVAFFTFLLLFMGALARFGTTLLIECCEMIGVASYEDVGRGAFGRKGLLLACLAIFIQNMGAMTSYMVVISTLMPQIMADFICGNSDPKLCDSVFDNRILVTVFMASVVILPLALMRYIDNLKFTSNMAIGINVTFCMAVVGQWFYSGRLDAADPNHKIQWGIVFDLEHFVYALPTMTFSFVCHTTLLPVYSELTNPTPQRMKRVALSSFLIAGSIYYIAAMFGYLLFRGMTPDDMINPGNLPDSILWKIVRILMLCSFTVTVPLIHYPCRRTVSAILYALKENSTNKKTLNNNNSITNTNSNTNNTISNSNSSSSGRIEPPAFSWKRHIIIADVLVGTVLTLALTVPNIKSVFGVAGASSAVSLMFILPAAFYCKIAVDKFGHPLPSPDMRRKFIIARIVSVFGAAVGIVCTAGIIYTFFHPVD